MTKVPKPRIRTGSRIEMNPIERTQGASMQVLLGPDEGARGFVTRRFSLEPGGRIPCHRHDEIEHQQYVVSGEMVLTLDGDERCARQGDAVIIPAGVAHSYENRLAQPVEFLCIVPLVDDYQTEWLE